MARPRIYNADDINRHLIEYMDNTDDPYVEEFILTQAFSPDTFYRLAKECKPLSDTIKALHLKQAMRTIRKAESGDINTTFAIFKLKQKCYGWSDKQEVDQTISNKDDKPFKVEIEVIK
jgi:hypothetical protein